MIKRIISISLVLSLFLAFTPLADASHSWGSYHWARSSNPFNLKLGDNVSSAWDAYLNAASADWSQSAILNTVVVPGQSNVKNCKATLGRVEVCNNRYGNNGWLGIAQIWVSGSHITQAVTKMNDTYFNTASYNTPAWRQFVICQEIGHTFGLDHQDENFNNLNLGTCMDYTNNPGGNASSSPSNLSPNAHDYEQLETIYAHLDSTTTVGASVASKGNRDEANLDDPSAWGNALRKDGKGRDSMLERDLGHGQKVFTFVVWAE